MESEKRDVGEQYEPPRVVDHGGLFEMTANGQKCNNIDFVFKGGKHCPPPRFS